MAVSAVIAQCQVVSTYLIYNLDLAIRRRRSLEFRHRETKREAVMRCIARVVTVACTLALAACVTEGGAPPEESSVEAPGLVSEIEIASDLLGKDDSVVVHWSLTNEGATMVSLPRWQVPSAELEENLFDITRDGVRVRYYGKLAKRAEPSAEDLVAIAPEIG